MAASPDWREAKVSGVARLTVATPPNTAPVAARLPATIRLVERLASGDSTSLRARFASAGVSAAGSAMAARVMCSLPSDAQRSALPTPVRRPARTGPGRARCPGTRPRSRWRRGRAISNASARPTRGRRIGPTRRAPAREPGTRTTGRPPGRSTRAGRAMPGGRGGGGRHGEARRRQALRHAKDGPWSTVLKLGQRILKLGQRILRPISWKNRQVTDDRGLVTQF